MYEKLNYFGAAGYCGKKIREVVDLKIEKKKATERVNQFPRMHPANHNKKRMHAIYSERRRIDQLHNFL